MISSMTGFGRARANTVIGPVGVEVRSVNYRYLETIVRLPNALSFLEMPLRERVKECLRRGKVDIFVKWDPLPDFEPSVEFNTPLIERLIGQYDKLRRRLGLNAPLDPALLLQLPQCIIVTSRELNEQEAWGQVAPVVDKALEALVRNRLREGRQLRKALKGYVDELERGARHVERERETILADYRQRLRTRVAELLERSPEQLDQGRIEMEVALLAEKSDVAEEIVRLMSHIEMVHQLLSAGSEEPVGRQLDFLCVELQREVNTLGAKCRTQSLLPVMLEMKNLIEKLREQVQNIE
ncbi:MAG: YicC family protein [Candidatus Sumerlaeia bacterium]